MGKSLIPKFSMKDIDRDIDKFKADKLKKMFRTLTYVGIQTVNYARQHHTYIDQTGNLTSSIAYAIIFNGAVKKLDIAGEKEGELDAIDLVNKLAKRFDEGMQLVVVAGMEYAAAVESMGYDVITGAAYEGADLMKTLKRELGAVL